MSNAPSVHRKPLGDKLFDLTMRVMLPLITGAIIWLFTSAISCGVRLSALEAQGPQLEKRFDAAERDLRREIERERAWRERLESKVDTLLEKLAARDRNGD